MVFYWFISVFLFLFAHIYVYYVMVFAVWPLHIYVDLFTLNQSVNEITNNFFSAFNP